MNPLSNLQIATVLQEFVSAPRSFAQIYNEKGRDKFERVGRQRVHIERAGRGEPVILLHGFGCSSYSWRHVQPGLATEFSTFAPDLNGFGYTERPRGVRPYTIRGQVRLILRILEHYGLESAHFVGHSYGGGLTLWIAAHHPQRVRSMTLVDPGLPTYSTALRRSAQRWRWLRRLALPLLISRRAIRNALLYCTCDPNRVTPEVIDAYRERLRIEGVEQAYLGFTAPVDERAIEIDLARIQAPALLVWGAEDRLQSLPGNGVSTRELLPNLTKLEIPNCGHLPMEECPQELLAGIQTFLRAQTTAFPARHARVATRRERPRPHLARA